MRVERRKRVVSRGDGGETFTVDAVLAAETKEESKILDEVVGSFVGEDGWIGSGAFDVRLSDGYGDHYVLLKGNRLTTRSTTVHDHIP